MRNPIIVIEAGAARLAAAKYLSAEGVDIVIFERKVGVGRL